MDTESERHNSVVCESEHRGEGVGGGEEGRVGRGGGALGPWAQKVQQHSGSAAWTELSCTAAAHYAQSQRASDLSQVLTATLYLVLHLRYND